MRREKKQENLKLIYKWISPDGFDSKYTFELGYQKGKKFLRLPENSTMKEYLSRWIDQMIPL